MQSSNPQDEFEALNKALREKHRAACSAFQAVFDVASMMDRLVDDLDERIVFRGMLAGHFDEHNTTSPYVEEPLFKLGREHSYSLKRLIDRAVADDRRKEAQKPKG